MQNPNVIVATAIALLIAGIIFFVPIGTVEEVETYFTSEPLKYEKSLISEKQVSKWIFFQATEVQYIVKNADEIDGLFTLNFLFSNEKETKSSTTRIAILAGAQEAVTEVSPLNGVSNVILNVIPPNKQVRHERIVIKEVTTWDRLRELRSIFGK